MKPGQVGETVTINVNATLDDGTKVGDKQRFPY